jgi:anti-sigma factor RsiW
MHKRDPTDLKPCPHMRTLVSARIDGNLTGLAKWYTERHIHDCEQCSKSVPFLQRMQERLRGLEPATVDDQPSEQLTTDRWRQLESALDKVDSGQETSNEKR